ncbi:MAG: hypothetical protein RLY31_2144 [Bacteroidota bacterium]|jgi:CDP-diacylglycerol--serine O-phosphatidyltransferase
MIKRNIPNAVTLLNLLFGCCALASTFYGQFQQAFLFSLGSLAADYLDGLLARILRAKSPLGQQLDSLADMVSFGVVPGAALYMLLVNGLSQSAHLPVRLSLAASPAFLLTLFAAVRLGRFNLDTRQQVDFIGLPTPACTAYAVGLLTIHEQDWGGLAGLVSHPVFLAVNVAALSWLMVSPLHMFSLKPQKIKWAGNEIRYIFAFCTLGLTIWWRETALSPVMILYLLFSIFFHFTKKTAASDGKPVPDR